LHRHLDTVALVEAPVARLPLDGAVVDEHVLPTVVTSDEAVALRAVEPLHRTLHTISHWVCLLYPTTRLMHFVMSSRVRLYPRNAAEHCAPSCTSTSTSCIHYALSVAESRIACKRVAQRCPRPPARISSGGAHPRPV